jgi:hypothetical protein
VEKSTDGESTLQENEISTSASSGVQVTIGKKKEL